MDVFTLLGIFGGIIGVALYLPQIVKTLQTKSAKDLAWGTYALILVNDIIWTIWGIGKQHPEVFVPNGIAVFLSCLILALKKKYDKNESSRT